MTTMKAILEDTYFQLEQQSNSALQTDLIITNSLLCPRGKKVLTFSHFQPD